MKTYIIMAWDSGEKHPTGQGFFSEEQAKKATTTSWLEYEEVTIDMSVFREKLILALDVYERVQGGGAAKAAMLRVNDVINSLI